MVDKNKLLFEAINRYIETGGDLDNFFKTIAEALENNYMDSIEWIERHRDLQITMRVMKSYLK